MCIRRHFLIQVINNYPVENRMLPWFLFGALGSALYVKFEDDDVLCLFVQQELYCCYFTMVPWLLCLIQPGVTRYIFCYCY